ncbi:hypothetical protein C8T65DRAFT_595945 [Cerioporus squamosus]|nr:hypothetical protein C8T65DRAFT_595945 [Cerioporus squamosus]
MLVRELWPPPIAATLAALDDGVSTEMDSLPPWTVVPDDYDELCGWAIIMPDEVDKGNSVLLYSPDINPLDNGEQLKVSIILHGVVEAVNLNPLGNWNGMKETTQRAVQYVTLGAGSWPEIFGKQVEALGKIKDFVGSVLRDDIGDYTRSPETTIYCHRPVFTRVRAFFPQERVKSVLKAGDDPHGRAKIVEKMWVVGHRVRTGIRTGEENHSRPPSVIRVGDFVEVAACIDIIRQKKNKSWERKMRLTITEVVRTHSSDEVKVRLTRCSRLGLH